MPSSHDLLGAFIKGRIQFLEEYCKSHGLDPKTIKEQLIETMEEFADDENKREFIRSTFGSRVFSPLSRVPNWLDYLLLRSLVYVLEGDEGRLYSESSDHPSIPFEAGRFNAREHGDGIFHSLFRDKTPETWLTRSFPVLYSKCYGESTPDKQKVHIPRKGTCIIDLGPRESPGKIPIDCTTIMGYLYGGLEIIGARNIKVRHDKCSVRSRSLSATCIFEVQWE